MPDSLTHLVFYLYFHLRSNTCELAMLLNSLTACNITSISGTHTQHALIAAGELLLHVPLKHTNKHGEPGSI